jgi:DNA-binding Xre family transcriptional regulator
MTKVATSQTAQPVCKEGGLALFVHAGELRGSMPRTKAAKLVGIRADELAKIERGETSQVRWVTLLKLMRAYRCSLSDLVEVRTEPATSVRPAYAKGLAALRSGRLKPGLPARRYTPEYDEEAVVAQPGEAVKKMFGDEAQPKRGRKAPFRPTAKQRAE